MNIKQSCDNCGSANSLISVFTIEYNKNTHSNKTAFRLCKKCGHHSKFMLNVMAGMVYYAYFVPDQYKKELKSIHCTKEASCIFCEMNKNPPYRPNEIKRNCVIKLYIKPRKYLGYYCSICRRSYYHFLKGIRWDKHDSYVRKREELLNPLNNHLTSELKENHPMYNKKKKIIEWFMDMRIIGGFTTAVGFPDGEPENIYTISIPKRRHQKVLKILKNNKCEIIR